jgi:hypothetical protein
MYGNVFIIVYSQERTVEKMNPLRNIIFLYHTFKLLTTE